MNKKTKQRRGQSFRVSIALTSDSGLISPAAVNSILEFSAEDSLLGPFDQGSDPILPEDLLHEALGGAEVPVRWSCWG